MQPSRNVVLEVLGAVVTEIGVFILWQVLGLIPSWIALLAFGAGIAVWIAFYFLYKKGEKPNSPEVLGAAIKKWLTDYGWSVRDFPPDPIDIFHFIITTDLGYELQVSQQKVSEPKEGEPREKSYVGIIGPYWIPPSQKAKLDKMSSEEVRRFYYRLQAEMAKGGYDWDVDPQRSENPNVVLPLFKGPPETASARGDFIREIGKVLKGLTLVIGYFKSELGE